MDKLRRLARETVGMDVLFTFIPVEEPKGKPRKPQVNPKQAEYQVYVDAKTREGGSVMSYEEWEKVFGNG